MKSKETEKDEIEKFPKPEVKQINMLKNLFSGIKIK
jgi:hypothetical protein